MSDMSKQKASEIDLYGLESFSTDLRPEADKHRSDIDAHSDIKDSRHGIGEKTEKEWKEMEQAQADYWKGTNYDEEINAALEGVMGKAIAEKAKAEIKGGLSIRERLGAAKIKVKAREAQRAKQKTVKGKENPLKNKVEKGIKIPNGKTDR